MTKLRDLERRLQEEPENLGLRVTAASALREVGRIDEAVELYRSVALAYRDQGRSQQAIAVCRSILEIAPDDPRCHALLATLVAGHKSASQPSPAPGLGRDVLEVGELIERPRTPTTPAMPPPAPVPEAQRARAQAAGEAGAREAAPAAAAGAGAAAAGAPADADISAGVPVRISQYDDTPLPAALPYHVADPTGSLQRISASDLPFAEGATTRVGGDDGSLPQVSGIANAARRISATLIAAGRTSHDDDDDLAAQLDTLQRPRLEPAGFGPEDDQLTGVPSAGENPAAWSGGEDAQTFPQGLPRRALPLRAPTADDDAITLPPPLLRAAARGSGATRTGAVPAPVPAERTTASSVLSFAFFEPLPVERRAAVLARFSRRTVPAGSTVIRKGEQGHPLVLVASGRLDVRAERPGGGAPVELGPITAGEHVGEAALLARAPAPAHVIAAIESELLLLAPRDFYEIAGANPDLWAQLKELAERRSREHAARLAR